MQEARAASDAREDCFPSLVELLARVDADEALDREDAKIITPLNFPAFDPIGTDENPQEIQMNHEQHIGAHQCCV